MAQSLPDGERAVPASAGPGALASIEQVVGGTVSGLSVPPALLLPQGRGTGLVSFGPSSRIKKQVSP